MKVYTRKIILTRIQKNGQNSHENLKIQPNFPTPAKFQPAKVFTNKMFKILRSKRDSKNIEEACTCFIVWNEHTETPSYLFSSDDWLVFPSSSKIARQNATAPLNPPYVIINCSTLLICSSRPNLLATQVRRTTHSALHGKYDTYMFFLSKTRQKIVGTSPSSNRA